MTTTRYFALVRDWDRPRTNPFSVFREVRDGFSWEIWDRALGAWREELGMAAYSIHGEIGDIPITQAEAERIILAQA